MAELPLALSRQRLARHRRAKCGRPQSRRGCNSVATDFVGFIDHRQDQDFLNHFGFVDKVVQASLYVGGHGMRASQLWRTTQRVGEPVALAVTPSSASALGELLGAIIFRRDYGELGCAFHVEPGIIGFQVMDYPQPRFAVIQASARRFSSRDGVTWAGITDAVLSQCGKETRVVTVDRRS
jgi:hypothetical protein